MVLVGSYLQALGEHNDDIHPETLQAFAMRRLYRYILIVVMVTVGQYFAQLDYTKLIIEKNVILKQQEQLNEFFS